MDDDFPSECGDLGVGDSCVQQPDGSWTVVSGGDGFDSDPDGGSDLAGGFMALFVIVLMVAIGLTVYKVVMARDMARRSGMSEGEATALTLLDDNGLAATYLASNLRPAGRPTAASEDDAPDSATRLRELQHLLAQGLISQAEHDERRSAIIDGI